MRDFEYRWDISFETPLKPQSETPLKPQSETPLKPQTYVLHPIYKEPCIFPNTWHDLPRTKVRNRAKSTSSSVCRCQELVRTHIFITRYIEKILVENRAYYKVLQA